MLEKELSKKLELQAVGSVDQQFVGLLWFVSGSVFSTLAEKLAPFF
jgi:hypothetical protein